MTQVIAEEAAVTEGMSLVGADDTMHRVVQVSAPADTEASALIHAMMGKTYAVMGPDVAVSPSRLERCAKLTKVSCVMMMI